MSEVAQLDAESPGPSGSVTAPPHLPPPPSAAPPPPPAPAAPASEPVPGTVEVPTTATPTEDPAPTPAVSPPNTIDQSALRLPNVPAQPSAGAVASPGARPGEFPLDPSVFGAAAGSAPGRRKRGGLARSLGALLVVGGLAAAGWVWGPELYDEYVGSEDGVAETEAPLAFPTASIDGGPIRSATFVLEGLPERDALSYTVQTDFQAPVSRVLISRADEADLEIVTFGEDSYVRRSDAGRWYQVGRGTFPLDAQLVREDWVRRLDELVPPTVRPDIEIVDATVSDVEGTPARRLVLLVDPALIGPDSPVVAPDPMAGLDGDAAAPAAPPPPPDPAAPPQDTAPPPQDTAAPSPAPAPASPDGAAPAPDPAPAASPVADPIDATRTESTVAAPVADGEGRPGVEAVGDRDDRVEIVIWVDAAGVIRRLDGAPMFGADSIRVISTSPDAWQPQFPAPDLVEPLTASALVELGL